MSDALAGVRQNIRDAFEFYGELGQDGTGRHVLLAKDRTRERLVAVRVESSSDVTVLDRLDDNVPAGARSCPICNGRVQDWRSYCGHCGSDIAGVSTASAGLERRKAVEQALRRTTQGVEVLGEMPRGDGGVPVYFGRNVQTGQIVALSLHDETSVTGGHNLTVQMTALAPSRTGEGFAAASHPAPQRAGASVPADNPSDADPHARQCPTCGRQYGDSIRFCPHDGSVLQLIGGTDDLVGQVIADRYHILKKIGQGAMGLVYLAEHVKMGRRCAIKVMHRSLSPDLSAVNRFGREAANASKISHTNVATIYDFGETKDRLIYLAMEYVEGEALARPLERGERLDVARVVSIGCQIADALEAAHRQRVVHRDLKPDNILIGTDHLGRDLVKVVDFGIAKAMLGEADGLTRTGVVIGTPRYMSPEQLIAEPVDGRSDIYSLGCILFELLVGGRPFGDTPMDLPRRLTEAPPHPRERNHAITHALDAVVVRALARKPEDRFQSAAEMRDALAQAATVDEPRRGPAFFRRLQGQFAAREPKHDVAAKEPRRAGTGPTPAVPDSSRSGQTSPRDAKVSGARTGETKPRETKERAVIATPVATAPTASAAKPPTSERTAPVVAPNADGDTPVEQFDEPTASGWAGLTKNRRAIIAAIVLLLVGAVSTALIVTGGDGGVDEPVAGGDNPTPPEPGVSGQPVPGAAPGSNEPGGVQTGPGGGGVVPPVAAPDDSTNESPDPPLPLPATLVIAGLPSGASVSVNGRQQTQRRITLPPERDHTIAIMADGYEDFRVAIRLRPGESREWSPELQRAEQRPAPPPPPPTRPDFRTAAAETVERFRRAIEARDVDNFYRIRVEQEDTEELRRILNNLGSQRPQAIATLPPQADSAQSRFVFLLMILDESRVVRWRERYIAGFFRDPNGEWKINSITRQRQ